MSIILVRCLLLVSWFLCLDCEVYQNRPKIRTQDGDLLLEAAFDKSIYLLPNGPKSKVYVGEVNILSNGAFNTRNEQRLPTTEDFTPYLNGPDGILQRLERLEQKSVSLPNDLSLNISTLWIRFNRLNRKVIRLQAQLNNRGRDECLSQPCQHGGTCLNLVNGYHCLCPLNWEGKDCDVDVNECRNFAGTELGCQNGATCINRPGFYECLCRSDWYGLHCTRKAKDCSGGDFEMCGHGTCIATTAGDGIRCICHQGWTTNGTSATCLTDINECEASQGARCSVNPKVPCINLPGSFRCGQCPPGYEGDGYSCSDINECVTLPNGGCSPMVTCHNTVGSRICGSCPPGYQGDGITCSWRGSCNINHGGCHPSAQCIENPGLGGTQCICPEGMEGNGVGLQGCVVSTGGNNTQRCESNPCGAHGQCHALRTGYTCICYKGYSGAHCEVTSVNLCAVNPCLNGGVCRPDDTIMRGFRCECTSQYSGPLCQVPLRSCGGVLDNEEGSIVYPAANTTYAHNSRCAWVIHTVPEKVINVTFSKFNLEAGPDCQYDFLQIHDGRSSASQLIGRFCGNVFPKGGNIISSHNNLYFWFRSDGSVSKNGFALHWTSINPVCGGEIDASTHGYISSPGSPGKYPPNRDCYWHLTTTLGKRIQLHFFGLDIEAHNNCSNDYLEIFDGEHSTDPLISRYCNSTQPAPIHSASSEMLMHFHSNAHGAGNGFQIAFAPTEGVPGCGGYFTADKGELFSPSFNGSYLENLICEYKIKTTPETRIQIEFQSFKLERSFRCKFDYLKIYDGSSANSQLVGKFCGTTYPKSYVSTSNTLFFKFKSDNSMSTEGFRLTYKTVCKIEIQGDSGIIKSPGYPFSYPENRVCEYVIRTTPGKVIQLRFQDFNIEDSIYYNCHYDHVEIRDGPDANSTLLGSYCGGPEHTPPMQISSHNYMYVRFVSDMSLSNTGFYANYTTIEAECGGIYRTTTGLINHPSETSQSYKNDQSCTWLLVANEGQDIKLTWHRFDLEMMTNCESDYVELIEIDENNQNNIMGRYCGTKTPPALTVSTNRLMIKFISDSSIRSSGFSVSYAFLDEKTHCGGMYIKTHGFIYSPGWPKSYEPNKDCTWIIQVPNGQQIKLNVSQFDLERPIQNRCHLGDYLEIRNGGSDTSPLIGQFCGKFNWRVFTSMSNTLHLHFHSDFYLTGKGFKIEWDGSITGCGGTLTSSTGSITSPNYPNNYNENAECFYKIVTNPGSRIRISFRELDIEKTYKCNDDYVEIFDGRDSGAQSLGKYCRMTPELSNIETSSNYAFIKFRSDFYISDRGFFLNYNTICQNNITGRYGVIESPDYPNNSPQHLDCLWNITVPKGNKINVTFTHLDIRRSYFSSIGRYWAPRRSINSSCDSDYLQTKELSETQFSSTLCGFIPIHTISTKTNSLQIKYVTGNIPRTGFRLEWVSYGCGGHIQKNFGKVTLDRSSVSAGEMECEWLLETVVGNTVAITFTDVFMTDNINCTVDAIEIYNGKDLKAPLLTRMCHRDKSWVQATGNFMLVRFIKNSNLKDIFINAHFYTSRAICGGHIESLSGFIYSKNYPKNYDDNLDCTWKIIVPRNHHIELNFIDIDLYTSNNDDTDEDNSCGDHIKIYDNINGNYTHKICAINNTTKIITRKNIIYVQFISDKRGTAKGFKIGFNTICGAVISAANDGTIANDINSHTSSCTWTIIADKPDQKISLTITHLSLQGNVNQTCSSSYIRIYDGDDKNGPLINEYCGRKIPPTIVSDGSAITVELGTHRNNIEGQFSAHYSPLSNACGGTLTSEEGTIASPNYPRPYTEGANCEWILKTSPGNKVYITFERFDLEQSEGCNEDYLEVREDSGGGTLLGVFCGNSLPTNTTVATKLYIKFHSNMQNSGEGFLIHYGFLHGNEITGDSGEVASPLYPYLYHGSAEYSWRIETTGTKAISLTVDRMEIRSYGDVCYNKLSIYDGYDDTATLLEELCGMLGTEKVLETTSNVVYIKLFLDESNTGSMFHLTWVNIEKEAEEIDSSDKINCGSNKTETISPGTSKSFTSPNYPNDYDDELKCEWIFKASTGNHLSLHFDDFRIEETSGCFADYVTIYTADTFGQWKVIKNTICLSESVTEGIDGSNYMKVIFKTDTSITKRGFQGTVTSLCGGTVTELSGTIGPLWQEINNNGLTKIRTRCDWIIKVRPGRLIQIHFQHFNISNSADDCVTQLILHNGESLNSPMLGNGKYCGYAHENKTDLTTSGNAVMISYITNHLKNLFNFQSFRLHYEEKNIECGLTTKLDLEHSWEVINSPNHPNPPLPYSECIWVISGPPGEIIRIDFIDRFDLDDVDDCSSEVVEIRDGSSALSPLLGRFCGDRPGTVKTTNNVAYIKYVTQLAEPRNGFTANMSIDVCGGTIVSRTGEILSPSYPHLPALLFGSVCEWRIIGSSRHIILLQPQDIHLPDSETPCGTKITIEELISANNTITILKTICNEDIESKFPAIETSTNDVMIKLHVDKPSAWTQMSQYRGFRFTFNSSRPICGGTVTTAEGFLTTPSYPLETTLTYCQWHIKVPDKSRSIRLEIIDANSQNHRIGIFNDLQFLTAIMRIPDEGDLTPTTNTFDSNGNTMSIYVWLAPLKSRHRFKAKFTSDNPALCGGELNGLNGSLVSPDLQRSYTCKWHYNNKAIVTNDDLQYNSIYITVNITSSVARTRCRYYDPKLNIRTSFGFKNGMPFIRDLCGNTEAAYRIPSSAIDLKATKSKTNSIYFNLQWKAQPCGGIFRATETAENILKVPSNYSGTLDCSWIIVVPDDNRIELKMDGLFQLECDDEYLKIHQSVTKTSSLIGDFCKTKTLDNPLITNFHFIYVEYHSNVKENTSIMLTARAINDQCGGLLLGYQSIFASPNFPKSYYSNQECTWEIKADWGNRISLSFIERFVIEDLPNCTKDALIIYDWKDDQYEEIARLCGRSLPHSYNSTFNRMKVVLRTDADINLDGFKARWYPICGGHYVATEKEHILYSPNYPYEYTPILDCHYEISGGGHKVIVKFLEFELEGTYPDCEYDNVTLISNSMSDYFYEVYCSNKLPPLISGSLITLDFKTDQFQQFKGFKLSYKIYSCGGHINTSTILTSNDFENYHENLNCTWFIEAPADKIVVLKFLYIDVEEDYDCNNDFLAVYDGLSFENDKRLAVLCGNISSSTTVLRSNGNTLLLQFVSDSSVQYKGFKVEVSFSYSTSVGCGGQINLPTPSASYTLRTPLIDHSVVYENFLDCQWYIQSPVDTYVKIEFLSFHISPCKDVLNQTAIGYSKCDCDYVQILDGLNPNSLVIGTYCGHTIPPQLISSDNLMSVRLTSDGELTSSGFVARITVQRSVCGKRSYSISDKVELLKSPGYDTGSVPHGLHCAYQFKSSFDYSYYVVRVRVTVDLQPPESGGVEKNRCIKDKLLIAGVPNKVNTTFGKDLIVRSPTSDFFYSVIFYDVSFPKQVELCGLKEAIDFYVYGDVYINLITSPESDNLKHKGVQIEVSYTEYCARNYTESQGAIKSTHTVNPSVNDCYTLITAPENRTISLYFLSITLDYWGEHYFIDIYDGNNTSAEKLIKITSEYTNPVFSSGRYILLHNHAAKDEGYIVPRLDYYLVYMTTDKGRGCGGRLMNIIGRVTSPLYPQVYRNKTTCEWELETPSNTRLMLRFEVFDMGVDCDHNYLQLVNKDGEVISSFCSESPADYTSADNYLKLIFVTTLNNGGTGWIANFVGIL